MPAWLESVLLAVAALTGMWAVWESGRVHQLTKMTPTINKLLWRSITEAPGAPRGMPQKKFRYRRGAAARSGEEESGEAEQGAAGDHEDGGTETASEGQEPQDRAMSNESPRHAYLVVRMFGLDATPELHLGYLIAHADVDEASRMAATLNSLRGDKEHDLYSYDIARIEIR